MRVMTQGGTTEALGYFRVVAWLPLLLHRCLTQPLRLLPLSHRYHFPGTTSLPSRLGHALGTRRRSLGKLTHTKLLAKASPVYLVPLQSQNTRDVVYHAVIRGRS